MNKNQSKQINSQEVQTPNIEELNNGLQSPNPDPFEIHVDVKQYIDGLTSEIVQTPSYGDVFKSMTSSDLKNQN